MFLIGRDAKHKQSSELHSKFFGGSGQAGKPGSQMEKEKGLPLAIQRGMCVGLSERGPALLCLCFALHQQLVTSGYRA